MPELLFEIGTEELPSWYVRRGAADLAAGLRARLESARLAYGEIRTYATPRRLAVHVVDLAGASERRSEARRGPSAAAAFDESGEPTRAAQGFARGQGVDPSALVVEETERGSYVFAHIEVGGEAAGALLPPMLAELVAELPAPRKMRWGDVQTPFVRPVAWLLALLDGAVLPVVAAGRSADRVTYGHRFLAPDPLEIDHPAHYAERLRDAHVVADRAERRAATLDAARSAASEAGLVLAEEPALLDEVTDLVELPIGVLGAFDRDYLSLPDGVLTKVMIQHQRYFPTRESSGGTLAANFVSVSNNRVSDPELIRKGYQHVLDGRLYDARFFWDADLGKSLAQHAWALSGIGFHKQLGTMADKVARVGEASPAVAIDVGLAEDEREALEGALPVFRADLATEMVVEFPDLEGVMARAYALEEGLPKRVAAALEDGVLPRGPGAPLPSGGGGALLAVMDRLDKLIGFFSLGRRPSGSADPFALRRDANAVARILTDRGWGVRPSELIAHGVAAYRDSRVEIGEVVADEVEAFVWDRVASLLAEEGIAISVVRAAAAGGPPVVAAARRAHLLRALLGHAGFPDLMTLYKRAANLAARAPVGLAPDPRRFEDPHEAPLHDALPAARSGVEALLAAMRRSFGAWDLGAGPAGELEPIDDQLQALLALKDPLDAFLDNVLVMVEDEALRDNRLALLAAVRDVLADLGALEELEGMQAD